MTTLARLKFIQAYAMKTKEASGVAARLFKVNLLSSRVTFNVCNFCGKVLRMFDLQRAITSDQGGEFNNAKLMGIEHTLSPPGKS